MTIVAFGHRRRMGKSTAARFLLNHLRASHPGIRSQQFGFSDKVKSIAHQMYNWGGLEEGIYYENHPEYKEQVLPPIGKSPRDIWIELGLAGRSICIRTWAELALGNRDCDMLVCYDLRDPIEADYVHEFGGYVIEIVKPDQPIFNDALDGAMRNYEKWDGKILNDGTLKYLNQKIKIAAELVMRDERKFSL